MSKLPLNDSRWAELMSRNGKASFVPRSLEHLIQKPGDVEAFQELWPELCSEGTAWSASYAAVPYIVEIARKLPPNERFEHVWFIGYVAQCECLESGESFHLQPYLAESYQMGLREGLQLIAETITCPHDQVETGHLLASIAALKGHRALGGVIEHLDCGCPHCGEEILPD